jgi:probable F420-dependent oxidoreductase
MRIGIRMPYASPLSNPDFLSHFVETAESLGFYSVFMSDHILIPNIIKKNYPYNETGQFDEPNDAIELMTSLAFVAARTNKIRLMTGIMVAPYRNPVLAAKMLATIDYLSKGRLIVGIGTGWMKEEFEYLGVPFEERGSRVDEYIQIYKELWTKDFPDFHGKYSKFRGASLLPKPVQSPHPPIWIGGESSLAMKRAAKYGDAWMPIGSNPRHRLQNVAQLKIAIEQVRDYTKETHRDPNVGLEFAYLVPQYNIVDKDDPQRPFVGTPEKIISSIRDFESIGVSFLGFEIFGRNTKETIEKLKIFAQNVMDKL